MKEILLTIGMGLAGLLNLPIGDGLPAQDGESGAVMSSQMTELDIKLKEARIASQEENFEKALILFEELEANNEDRYYWASISGQKNIYRRQYEFDKVLEVVNRAENKFPEAAGLMHIWKGDTEVHRGNYDKAIQEYELSEQNYGQTIVNEMVIGEIALKQAAKIAIKAKNPSKASELSRKMALDYPQVGNPEAALARALLYDIMAQGEMEIGTLEDVVQSGYCNENDPCFFSKDKKIKKKDFIDIDSGDEFEILNDFPGLKFELEQKDKDVLENIKKISSGDKTLLESLIPEAKALTSFTTCSVDGETASDGFQNPYPTFNAYGYFFMSQPAGDGHSYHPGVDFNGPYDYGYTCDTYQATAPFSPYDVVVDDRFEATASGCVQEASTADWGSITITHNYLPYNASYTQDYITSQYGHADEVFVSLGDAVGKGDVIGSVGGIDSYGISTYACHLHFEIREPDHPDPYNAAYWGSGYLLDSKDNVGDWYQDPESFINAHPALTWARWIDEGYSGWDYDGTWTYFERGNGDDYGENDMNYMESTSSSIATSTATLSFTSDQTGLHALWIFSPWSSTDKSDAVPIEISSVDTGSVLYSDTIDSYGEWAPDGGCGDLFGGKPYPGKICDEWLFIDDLNLTAGESYEMAITNNTGTDGDLILVDDVLFIYNDGSGTFSGGHTSIGAGGTGGGGDGVETSDVCSVPSSGDWTVSDDCSLNSDATAPANVLVDDGITLQIESGVTLDMDLSSYHLNIGNGSRVVIEEGAKID